MIRAFPGDMPLQSAIESVDRAVAATLEARNPPMKDRHPSVIACVRESLEWFFIDAAVVACSGGRLLTDSVTGNCVSACLVSAPSPQETPAHGPSV